MYYYSRTWNLIIEEQYQLKEREKEINVDQSTVFGQLLTEFSGLNQTANRRKCRVKHGS